MIPEGWTLRESTVEYETGWYVGGYDLYEQPDGTEKRYYWAELPPAAVVVARDGDELVMVEQFRPPIRESCLELPAGIVEVTDGDASSEGATGGGPAEPAAYEAAARRELVEETGYEAADVTFLERFWCATGVLRHQRGIVFASDLEHTDRRALDTNEFIDVVRVPVDEALALARESPANDATIEGLALAETEGLL